MYIKHNKTIKMEVKELISFYLDESSEILEVSFRTLDDQDDEIRQDEINFDEIEKFGYNFVNNKDQDFLFEDEDSDTEYEEPLTTIDREDVISFLNEYYLIYPNKLPNSEMF